MFSAFPLAIVATSLLWDVVGLTTGQAIWWRLSFWSVVLGLAASVPTLATGLIDCAALPEGHLSDRSATRQRLVVALVVAGFGCSLLWLRPDRAPIGSGAVLALACSCIGCAGIAAGRWLSGVASS